MTLLLTGQISLLVQALGRRKDVPRGLQVQFLKGDMENVHFVSCYVPLARGSHIFTDSCKESGGMYYSGWPFFPAENKIHGEKRNEQPLV